VSNELLSDNTANLMAYLARWFAKKGIITENILLKSLLDSLSASNLTVGKEIKDIKTAINKGLDPDIALNAVVLTNQSGFDHLDQMEDLNGRPLLQPDPTTGTPMMFKSKPVIMVSDAMLPNRVVTATGATKGDYYPVYIGDFKSFGTLFRRNLLEVDSTDIGGNAWATASNEVRGIVRLDAQKIDEGAAIKREIFVTAN
jgi:HK97 family phage major capsid protein